MSLNKWKLVTNDEDLSSMKEADLVKGFFFS